MTQLFSTSARPRWRSALATFALVGALFAAGGAASASADVVGDGPGAITGSVTSNGTGLPGVYVNVYATQGAFWSASASTDADGHFALTGVPLGTYSVSTYVSGYQQVPQHDVSLTESSPSATADFVLTPFEVGTGMISGHVTGDGAPVPNFEVTIQNMTTGQLFWINTDENGYFSFSDLSFGNWQVNPGFSNGKYQPAASVPAPLTAAAPAATVVVALVSWPVGTASIHGIVTDSVTGEPIAGAGISVFSGDAPHQSNATSGADGSYSFDQLPAGTYYLSFGLSGYLYKYADVVLTDGTSVTLDKALVAANATISGHVQDVNGAPVVGLYVDAHTQGGNGIGGASTDANGDYLITNVGAVPYTLNVGGWGLYNAQERTVTPIANDNIVVDFILTFRTVGSLTGYPVGPGDEDLGQTHPICVTLYSTKTKKPLATTATFGPEFGDGTFYFGDLKPGTYTVEFKDCDPKQDVKFEKMFLGGVKNIKDATVVTIVAGQDVWLENVRMSLRGKK